ncbi:hypothetical protein B0H13DRAFT_1872978 [Mycena leptocephala]|nr:hypothetical protein B0H13DRAFT_1872978 [Mycena leptocephala]
MLYSAQRDILKWVLFFLSTAFSFFLDERLDVLVTIANCKLKLQVDGYPCGVGVKPCKPAGWDSAVQYRLGLIGWRREDLQISALLIEHTTLKKISASETRAPNTTRGACQSRDSRPETARPRCPNARFTVLHNDTFHSLQPQTLKTSITSIELHMCHYLSEIRKNNKHLVEPSGLGRRRCREFFFGWVLGGVWEADQGEIDVHAAPVA